MEGENGLFEIIAYFPTPFFDIGAYRSREVAFRNHGGHAAVSLAGGDAFVWLYDGYRFAGEVYVDGREFIAYPLGEHRAVVDEKRAVGTYLCCDFGKMSVGHFKAEQLVESF